MRKKARINSELFAIGAAGYSLIEIAWRGFTHWTMSLTGGVCFLAIYHVNDKFQNRPAPFRCLLCTGFITAMEFTVGCIVNLALRWNVWDYSGLPFNLLGQICPLYTALWFLLSLPLCSLSGLLKRKVLR